MSELIQVHPETPDAAIIRQVCDLLESGELVGVPTETVYGIACDPAHLDKLYRAKERDRGKPIARLAASLEQVEAFGADFGRDGKALAKKYWPGPLTLVLNTPNGPTGFRVPNHNVPLALARAFGRPIALTSANKSGNADAASAQEAFECFQGSENPVALYLDSFQPLEPTASGFRASPRSGNLFSQTLEKLRSVFPSIGKKKQVITQLPSTVVQCSKNKTKILREGAVSSEDIRTHLNKYQV